MDHTSKPPTSFRTGQKVRLTTAVDTAFIDPKYIHPGIDYDEYARMHEPVHLPAGSVAKFCGYLAFTPLIGVVTDSKNPTELCEIVLGRTRFCVVRMSPGALEACDPATPATPLAAYAADFPADHEFQKDPV